MPKPKTNERWKTVIRLATIEHQLKKARNTGISGPSWLPNPRLDDLMREKHKLRREMQETDRPEIEKARRCEP